MFHTSWRGWVSPSFETCSGSNGAIEDKNLDNFKSVSNGCLWSGLRAGAWQILFPLCSMVATDEIPFLLNVYGTCMPGNLTQCCLSYKNWLLSLFFFFFLSKIRPVKRRKIFYNRCRMLTFFHLRVGNLKAITHRLRMTSKFDFPVNRSAFPSANLIPCHPLTLTFMTTKSKKENTLKKGNTLIDFP